MVWTNDDRQTNFCDFFPSLDALFVNFVSTRHYKFPSIYKLDALLVNFVSARHYKSLFIFLVQLHINL